MKQGNIHPITRYLRESVQYFESLGFEVFESPQTDTEWYNFDALNVPASHPARDSQDTFYLKDGRVLRTHTSNGQIRGAKGKKPPFRFIIPGTVFRNEATDARHETTIFQLEGVYVDTDVKIGHLFWTLKDYLKEMFGEDIEVRFRPHHYPFVEPGIDVDMKYRGKWLEVLGSGMIHPIVIKNMGLNPKKYTGFAFGLGVDRMAMIKWNVEEIRHFRSGDLRFLKQF